MRSVLGLPCVLVFSITIQVIFGAKAHGEDWISGLQQTAAKTNQCETLHWGPNPQKYSTWSTHSNRLVPVYSFGVSLDSVRGEQSVYRRSEDLKRLYGHLPEGTHNPEADYFDQTDIYHLQKRAIDQGKRRVILFVFDGMDWQTSRAAAIAKTHRVSYAEGRGSGLHLQDYRGVQTDFGYCVASPHNNGTSVNVDRQIVTSPGGTISGGYAFEVAGVFPWSDPVRAGYPIGEDELIQHAFPDSAASGTSMMTGIKTYNDAINVDYLGREVIPIARTLQEKSWKVGVVTSVPISHATPACAYANNVHRDDYQDLTRELLGLPSIFHPGGLPGVDVLIGAGWGVEKSNDEAQGENFEAGNRYLTAADRQKIDSRNGGEYIVAERTVGTDGGSVLRQAVSQAIQHRKRLFGYFGGEGGHLPFQTANGDFKPVESASSSGATRAEVYSAEDLRENATLREMTIAAMDVLEAGSQQWWLMVEAGDVDWANHANNIDNSIGAVLSGDQAFQAATQWIETHGGWQDTCVIVTADHGHYLVLDSPGNLVATPSSSD
ncbi:alkaline phosphatase [Bremerella sp. JC770]|uniref:alkaline phosphatase n=1 Tax=Bremerella sp. JC770 TaxID=3232137 RepID=UPI0034585817